MFLKDFSYAHQGCIYLIRIFSSITQVFMILQKLLKNVDFLLKKYLSMLKTVLLLNTFVDIFPPQDSLINKKFKETAFPAE